jgi:Xaa-Pro aminopeptidase
MLDSLARAPLWAEGIEFGHGTGHGVGYFLAVHEGPQSISKAVPDPHMAMEPGMITSIEPGVYRAGQWGVRIENLVLNVPATTAEGGTFASSWNSRRSRCAPSTHAASIAACCARRSGLAQHLPRHRARTPRAALVEGAALAWLNERTAAL